MKNKTKISLISAFILAFAFIMGFGTVHAFSVNDMTLKFAHVSDTHISDRDDTSYKLLSKSKLLMAAAVKQLGRIENLDFVVFTGDLVDQPFLQSYKDFFTILSDLQVPSLVTFGNHDTGSISSETGALIPEGALSKKEVLKMFQDCIPNYKFDKTYYALSPRKDFRMIVLDAVIGEDMSSNGFMSDEQLEFLDNELRANKNKVVVIFQHHPVVEPFSSSHHKILNADKYLEIIQKYKNPIAIFSGHYHTTKITRQDNIIHVSTPSLVTYPNAFRVVSITNYKDRTIFDFYFHETPLKDVQAESKALAIASASFAGKEKDRMTTITIMKNGKVDKKAKTPKVTEEETEE